METGNIIKIAIIGAESSGKTWLCENLAQYYNTVWVPEYAREYFNDSDIYNYTMNDLLVIAEKQIQMEKDLIRNANGYLFCDTTLITIKIWAVLEFGLTPPFIEENLKAINYDHYFVTNNEMPWVADPLRQNKHSREKLMQMNIAELQALGASYSIIAGKDADRLRNAVHLLEELKIKN